MSERGARVRHTPPEIHQSAGYGRSSLPPAPVRPPAISAAARATNGPTRSTSRSSSATTPTDASTAGTPSTGAATPWAPRCSSPSVATYARLPRRPRPSRIARPAAPRSRGCRRTHPVGDVEVGPAGFDDSDRERLRAVGDGQVRGGTNPVRQGPQHRVRPGAQHRLHTLGQMEYGEPQVHAGVPVPAGQVMLLQSGNEPIHHGPGHAEPGGELVDGQPLLALGQQGEDSQPPVERLGGLRSHVRTLAPPPDQVAASPPRQPRRPRNLPCR